MLQAVSITRSKLRRALQTASIRWIDPLFAQHAPGPITTHLVRQFGPAVRLLQPNDQWNLAAFIDDWALLLDGPSPAPLPPPQRIFMFGCYRGQFTRDLVLAMLLAWRGHWVTFGYFPKLQSPIKDPLDDAPTAKDYLARVLGRVQALTRGRVTCCDLSDIEPDANVDEAYLASQIRADTIMRIRREQFDAAEADVQAIAARYYDLGRRAYGVATGYMRQHRHEFDLAVIANGASFENGYFCKAAREAGLAVTTHEKFAFQNALTVTHGESFFHFSDLDRVWERRHKFGLTSDPLRQYIRSKAWDLLNQRRTSSGRAWGWQYQQGTTSREAEDVLAKLGVRENGFALICPNVPFDAGYEGWLTLFPSMRQWLIQTVSNLLACSSIPVVIRAHPAEVRPGYGREQIAAVLAEAGLSDPRLVMIPGNSDINTYDLMPLCRFGAVFASTTGVEIAMHGKPVIAGAEVYYARCGISVPAADRESYFRKLADLATGAPGPANADDAALVYFLFHYLLQWRFPYDKPSQISATPPRRLYRHPDIAQFIETLDVLAMTPQAFGAALPKLVNLQRLASRWGWEPPAVEDSRVSQPLVPA